MLVVMHLALCSFLVCCIMAGMDQQEQFVYRSCLMCTGFLDFMGDFPSWARRQPRKTVKPATWRLTQCIARHFGRHGPEGQLRRRGQGLRSRSPWCGARVHCRMWMWHRRQGLVLVFTAACCSSSTRSYTPCRGAEVALWQLTDKVFDVQVVHGSSVAGVEKTVEIPQLQLVGGA